MDNENHTAEHMHDMDGQDIVIEDNNAFLMAMGDGSRIEIHGADADKESWTQLESWVGAGSNQITVQDSTGWEVGDRIAIASTSRSNDEHEEFSILEISDDGKTITLDGKLSFNHQGGTYHYDNGQEGEDYREWKAEMRAEVGLLSRNITIQGDEDSLDATAVIDGVEQWGYGGHTMAMHGAEQYISGAEFYRMGQDGLLGKYPIHWHMLDDAEGQYVENSSIHDTFNKGLTLHGSSNIRVEDNVIFNNMGHGVFLEDGSELHSQILGNLVFGTQSVTDNPVIPTDKTATASYWIENQSTILIGNHAAGSDQNGFMIFPSNTPHGDSVAAGVGGQGSMADLIVRDNVTHSNGDMGFSMEGRIQGDLTIDFGNIQQGAFATIEGLLAYNNGMHNVWTFTNNTIFQDLISINGGRTNLFNKGNTFVEDALLAGGRTGFFSYAQNTARFEDVHFEGHRTTDIFKDRISNTNAHDNVTSDSGVLRYSEQGSSGSNTHLIDLDGSVSGVAGAAIFKNDAGAAFNAGPGAYQIANGKWVSEATIGQARVTVGNFNVALDLERSDGVSASDLGDFRGRYYELKTFAGQEKDVAFLLDFDAQPGGKIDLDISGLLDGQSVVYEVSNLDGATVSNATEVGTFRDLLSADSNAYMFKDGSLFVRAVATGGDFNKPVDDLLGAWNASADINIRDLDWSDAPDPAPSISSDLISAIDAMPARDLYIYAAPEEATIQSRNDSFVLERYESTSDAVVVTDDMARWSDASTWGDAGVPGINDIVVIGAGQTVILDETVFVKGIIVDGGELIVEDNADLVVDLFTDYLLVVNGGLFQAGTEDNPLDTDFTLTLEGDDPDFDLYVTDILNGGHANTVFAAAADHDMGHLPHDGTGGEHMPMDDAEDTLIGQTGAVRTDQSDADEWHQVTFDVAMDDPIVVASLVTKNGGQAAHIRVQDVTSTGFEFQIEEWDIQDGYHVEETVSWTAVERGVHTLDDGSVIQAGSSDADHNVAEIAFAEAFADGPVVIGQVASENGAQAVVDRISNVEETGFSVRLQEEEANDGSHTPEEFQWIAFEGGEHESFSALTLGASHRSTTLNLDDTFDGALLTDMQTFNGGDTAAVRVSDIGSSAYLFVQEEQSADREVSHVNEMVGVVQLDDMLFA